jgi:hypothetical protein
MIEGMQIDALWLAWTEKRGDPQADLLRDKGQKMKEIVASVAARAGSKAHAITASIEHFNGPVATASRKLSSLEIIPALIERANSTGQVHYLEPGDVLHTPGAHSLRANVLGPPRNPALLMKDLPSGGTARETYLAATSQLLDERYAAGQPIADALEGLGTGPFARRYGIPVADVRARAPRGSEKAWLHERYYATDETWRRTAR